jgi:hypothetical protein
LPTIAVPSDYIDHRKWSGRAEKIDGRTIDLDHCQIDCGIVFAGVINHLFANQRLINLCWLQLKMARPPIRVSKPFIASLSSTVSAWTV